jgi:hypothetical protein
MAGVKLVVIYPRPKDVDAFEKVYRNEHVPRAIANLAAKTKVVATKILSSPQGVPPFYRIAEVHFPSIVGSRGMRRVGKWKRNIGPRRKDFDGWHAHFPTGGGINLHIQSDSEGPKGETCVSDSRL